jgi:hypothetical protein
METIISSLLGITPNVQALIIVGLFTIVIIAALRLKAAMNLISFLRDLHNLARGGDQALPGNRHMRIKPVDHRPNSHSHQPTTSDTHDLGANHQGAYAHEQHLSA